MNSFFGGTLDSSPPSKSAFCQARLKLKDTFYESFFYQTVQGFESQAQLKTFKNYRLVACDATVQKLPDNPQTRLIGIHKNQHASVASAKILTYHDVLNGITTYASFHDKSTPELHCAKHVIPHLSTNAIYMYDRGFACHLIPFLHIQSGSKFVIRLRTDQFNCCKALLNSSDSEAKVTEQIQYKAFKELQQMGIFISFYDKITYRIVKVPLSTGEIEVLMTNLDNSFTIEDLAEIYRQRWGVETAYNYFKNTLMMGTFSGYSALAVKQDLWCVLILYNLQTIIQYDCQEDLEAINKRRKKNYKINRNVGAGSLRNHLKSLFLQGLDSCYKALALIQKLFLASLEKVKPSTKIRLRKLLRGNDRHQTEMNYKRGF